MIADGLDYSDLRAQIQPILDEWASTVVPSEVEPLPHSRYSPQYAWMYAFEKRLKYRIEDTLSRSLGTAESTLFGPDGVLSEALSNAFVHGHRRNPTRAIELRHAVAAAGAAFSILDSGPGFDVRPTLTAASTGGRYASYGGNGFRSLLWTPGVTASFGAGGRRLDLLVLWPWTGSSPTNP